MIFFFFRRNKKESLTKDSYMDIESTIQDAFIVCSFNKKVIAQKSLYLILLGTDPLELLFGLVRTITHA